MSLIAQVLDGQIKQSASASSLSASKEKKGGDALGKEDFLKLLVAQMQYQDPLEPTSNTEYVSQFATFSELEQMQNVSNSMDMYRASNLVGQHVTMKVTNPSSGATEEITGPVDYVVYESNKAYLSINGNLYSIDDLDTIVDPVYYSAFHKSQELASQIADLAPVDQLSLADASKVLKILETYDGMNEYERSFFQDSAKEMIEAYRTQLAKLLAESSSEKDDSAQEDTEESATTTETVEV
ncbi:MAG: hypothetical protein E7294_00070 [Lachnospiraceae bacterium]|jgi:flagellar basal-body rod modification protein FlgD|nr:hypothetical protein [Lachnospiraceae bacterium]